MVGKLACWLVSGCLFVNCLLPVDGWWAVGQLMAFWFVGFVVVCGCLSQVVVGFVVVVWWMLFDGDDCVIAVNEESSCIFVTDQ